MKLTLVLFEGALSCDNSSAAAPGNFTHRCLLEQCLFVNSQIRRLLIAWLVFNRILSYPDLIGRHDTGTGV